MKKHTNTLCCYLHRLIYAQLTYNYNKNNNYVNTLR